MDVKKYWDIKRISSTVCKLTITGRLGGPELSRFILEASKENIAEIRNALDEVGLVDEIHVFINSQGGNSVEGFAIYEILKNHPAKKTVFIADWCGSAATIIAMVGARIVMSATGRYAIHELQHIVIGGHSDIIQAARELQRQNKKIIRLYAVKTGLPNRTIKDMLAKDTIMTAKEALRLGFIDEIDSSINIIAVTDGDAGLGDVQAILESPCLMCSFVWEGTRDRQYANIQKGDNK